MLSGSPLVMTIQPTLNVRGNSFPGAQGDEGLILGCIVMGGPRTVVFLQVYFNHVALTHRSLYTLQSGETYTQCGERNLNMANSRPFAI